MKITILLVCILFSSFAHCEQYDWFCFSSTEGKNIKLAFSFLPEDVGGGVIKYKNGNGLVELIQLSVTSEEMVQGRPFEYSYRFQEKVGGNDGGIYEVTIQGANFYQFTYTAKNKLKSYDFTVDPNSQMEKSCSWFKKS